MAEIIPAILAKSVQDLLDATASMPEEIKLLHIDILERDVWAATGRDFEVHLMVQDPGSLMEQWVNRGAKRIIVHKLTPEVENYKGRIELGLGVEMNVPIDSVSEDIEKADFVQLMSIAEIGEQGHPLDEHIFDRIREVKEKFPSKIISIDGGVNVSNYQRLVDAGADRLVIGTGFKELWTSQMKR